MALSWTCTSAHSSLIRMNPCGAICDFSRKPGWTTKCRFFHDRPDLVDTIRWYPALPGAEVLPYDSCILASQWDRLPQGQEWIGEVPGAPKPWYAAKEIPGALGLHVCGTALDFLQGCEYVDANPIQIVGSGLPVCCGPAIFGVAGAAAGAYGVVGYLPPFDYPYGGFGLGGPVTDVWRGADAPTGGSGLGGPVTEAGPGVDTPLGGLGLGGPCTDAWLVGDTPAGGLGLGGTVAEEKGLVDSPSGGLGLGGSIIEVPDFVDTPQGGLGLGGAVAQVRVGVDQPGGGLGLGGALSEDATLVDLAAGGLGIGGRVAESYTPPAPTPGSTCATAGVISLSTLYTYTLTGIGQQNWFTLVLPTTRSYTLTTTGVVGGVSSSQYEGGSCPMPNLLDTRITTNGPPVWIWNGSAGDTVWIEFTNLSGTHSYTLEVT